VEEKTTATVETNRKKIKEIDIESDGIVDGSFSSPVQEGPSLTIVNDLNVYEGQKLEEKVDSFINSHAVIMFHKTWCLFSLDAQSFLAGQLKVSLHAIEVDIHPQGAAILKYVQEKNDHRTIPAIYIKGTFMGGFDDVNQLYATSQLQELYLIDLTQADRSEEFITKAKVGTKPLFWFPVTVNAHVVRLSGVMLCLCAAFSAVSVHWVEWGRYVGYALFFDYVFRLLAGSRLSLLGQLATLMASPLTPKLRHGQPKQFATMCGIMFSLPAISRLYRHCLHGGSSGCIGHGGLLGLKRNFRVASSGAFAICKILLSCPSVLVSDIHRCFDCTAMCM
jgi:glutaredoxin